MTCRELIDFLMDYTEGRLEAPVRAEFERHLAVCSSCVAYLDSYRKTIGLARAAMADGPIPPEVPPALVNAILQARKRA